MPLDCISGRSYLDFTLDVKEHLSWSTFDIGIFTSTIFILKERHIIFTLRMRKELFQRSKEPDQVTTVVRTKAGSPASYLTLTAKNPIKCPTNRESPGFMRKQGPLSQSNWIKILLTYFYLEFYRTPPLKIDD